MKRGNLHLLTLLLTLGSFIPSSATAQLTPDNTLGAENSIVTPEATRQLIQGGTTRGSNLFHSFTDFNVGENQRVYFANPTDITNILTRVTGNNLSNILGTLGVDGAANLFLLNPNGIIFGPNAQLDIRGSFVATTADSILFDNNVAFSASDPQAPPLLTINVPIGLQYGSNSTATISDRGNLSVGGNLKLGAANLDLQGQLQAGGDLTLQATDTITIRDSETSPFIAAANGQLLVQGNEKIDIFALNHPDSGLYSGGDMVFRSANAVGGDAHYWSEGNFRIEDLQGNLGDLYSPYDPIIRSLGDVSFQFYVGASLHIFAAGSVIIPIGVQITGSDAVNGLVETVTLSDGSSLSIDGKTRPTLDIRAGMDPAAVGAPFFNPANFDPNTADYLFSSPPTLTGSPTSGDIKIDLIVIDEPNGQVFLTNQYKPNTLPGNITITNWLTTTSITGNSGDVRIDSRGNFTLEGEAQIDTRTISNYNAGNINIRAADLVEIFATPLSNPLYLSALIAGTWGSGNAGNIEVQAKRVSVRDGGFVYTRSHGAGRAGDINIVADESVELRGAPAYNHESALVTSAMNSGDAGNINIKTGHLLVQEGAQVAAESNPGSTGAPGKINIVANESVAVIGVPPYPNGKPTGIYTFTENDRSGGDIQIDTKRFIVRDGGSVSTGTDAAGNGGNLLVNASDYVLVTGASAFNPDRVSRIRAITTSSGDGGNLTINTGQLLVENGGKVSADSSNSGNSGTLTVNASDLVRVAGISPDGKNQSQLFFDSSGSGDAGQLKITTGSLQVLEGGKVSAATSGSGQGGLLEVNAANSVEVLGTSTNGQFVSSLIFDSSGNGNAGELRINAGQLLVGNGGKVSAATSNSGQGGILEVKASDFLAVIGTSSNDRFASSLLFDSSGTGNAGQLKISTGQLLVQDGGLVSAKTSDAGQGGILNVNAWDAVQVSGASSNGQFASSLLFDSSGTGNAGELNINTGRLLIEDGGKVSAGTSGTGRGGILAVNAADSVRVSGAGSRLYFDSTGAGDARGIRINTGDLTVENGGEITVNGTGTGLAGDLDITANSIFLNQQGNLLARTVSGEGGNIRLRVADNVLLRFNSNILTEALGPGNGGNITIDAGGFVLAVLPENSDVAATAIQGRGGNIFVTAKGVIGFSLPERLVRTPESDISAASELGIDGVTTINTRDVPSGVQLPDRVGTPTINSGCQAARNSQPDATGRSQFFVTGRGGLPPQPTDVLSATSVEIPWVTLEEENRTADNEVKEAKGWVQLADGRVFLVSQEHQTRQGNCSGFVLRQD
ncbi:filamentous hemagglutinin N-terminal domain-containing protein [Oscillatoria sp. FACHB-1406]|uniref:two-partner secretion domain-containing protein n=1 Tax=Oscillatoria sp. FACHB-1406 TaxID=2692846 RepID=UPI001684088E|nr:filamentous hemagglutinin N-terminal domain-containing protein [Oscillatoria sp. FACHB-1406]MBD2577567.1 filamentous hemagglutinin N-terminal domain-containing protein [Oscillatoria sp. FACHB-1406]